MMNHSVCCAFFTVSCQIQVHKLPVKQKSKSAEASSVAMPAPLRPVHIDTSRVHLQLPDHLERHEQVIQQDLENVFDHNADCQC